MLNRIGLAVMVLLVGASVRADEVIFDVSGRPGAGGMHVAAALPEAGSAHAAGRGPGALQLLLEGAALAIPDYFLGVTAHEGSHALAVILNGGTVTEFNVLPSMYHGHVRFGETGWEGDFTRTQTTMISLAPKVTDLALMATYSALLETGAYPHNRHLQLVLVVLAAGAWVDFTKDIFSGNPDNDTIGVMNDYGLTTERERLPYRLAWGGLAAAGAFEIGRGIYRLFRHPGDSDSDVDPAQPGRDRYGHPVVSAGYVGWAGRF